MPFRTEGQSAVGVYVGRRYGASAIHFDAVELLEDDRVAIGDVSPAPNPFPEPTAEEGSRGYVVSASPWLRLVYPTWYPTRDEVVSQLECRLAPYEYEPVTFALTSLRPLKRVSIGIAGDLHGPAGQVFPAANVSLGIVRTITRWLTNSAPLKPGQRFEPRPLLIYPNQAFDIPERETRQAWLTVYATPAQEPGLYRGEVVVVDDDGPGFSLPLLVTVRPIRLADPEPTYGMYYRHDHQPPEFQTEDFFRRCLADMKAHGTANGTAASRPTAASTAATTRGPRACAATGSGATPKATKAPPAWRTNWS